MGSWSLGRQDSLYQKLLLFQSESLEFDCYLLKYPTGSYIAPHVDPVFMGYEHWRINVQLWPAKKGGKFHALNDVHFKFGPIVFFRPDINEHSVSKIEKGTRYVFSFGWLTKKHK